MDQYYYSNYDFQIITMFIFSNILLIIVIYIDHCNIDLYFDLDTITLKFSKNDFKLNDLN